MTSSAVRRFQPVPAHRAVEEAPSLARLFQLVRESSERLAAVQPVLPPMLRGSVKAGPIDGGSWCLLVDNAAAAAKLRQLLPLLLARLRNQGYAVEDIRLKLGTRA